MTKDLVIQKFRHQKGEHVVMFWRILGKDIKKRKSINIILFLFITLASVFLSSSVNNIMVVASAIDYYMDYANLPDVSIAVSGETERDTITNWLKTEPSGVKSYKEDSLILAKSANFSIKKKGTIHDFEAKNLAIYISSMPTKYAKVFDEKGQSFSLKPGEIAIGKNVLENNGLRLGDSIIIKEGQLQKEFKVKLIIKDMAFGNEMSGTTRMIIHDDDYLQLKECKDAELVSLYHVSLSENVSKGEVTNEEVNTFTKEMSSQGFTTLERYLTKSIYRLLYSFDMIVAALLILIGICLILIAMLVLRFTLVFTMEEEYREIGIMKAIGLKGFDIKRNYLVKYLSLVVIGAVLGLGISLPVSTAMVDSVAANMIMEDSSVNLWLNILCTIVVILIVLLFCYRCTHKMDKISSIAAIRGGQTGERYSKKMGLCLYKRRKMPVTAFLGLNDMISHVRSFLILILTFCISFILITIPLNTINTMRSREMIEKFGINPDSAVYIREIELLGESYTNTEQLMSGMKRVEQEMLEKGYEAKLTGTAVFFLSFVIPDSKEASTSGSGKNKASIMSLQLVGPNPHFLVYDEGEEPILENEIAFSKQIMELYGWNIGDSVEVMLGGEQKKLLITGSYADYMQLGQSARLSTALDCSKERMFDNWNIMVDMQTKHSSNQLLKELKDKFPDYQWSDAQEIVDMNVGSIQQTLDDMLLPITGMLCILIMLITVLMEKLFIVREKGEIAMLKSVGYRNQDIGLWQVMRMIYVALFSMVVAVPLSLISNRWILRPIFGIMGAEVTIQVKPWQVYGVYPGILFIGIVVATIIATKSIKKISIQEMNHME